MSPTSKDEALLTSAVDRTGELVAEGMAPTAALTKTAQELQLLPGFIRTTSNIFNSGAQVDQFTRGKTATDKLQAMELADPEAVIESIYGKKQAAVPVTTRKVASDAFQPLRIATPEPIEVPAWFFGEELTPKTATDTKPDFMGIMKKLASEREGLEELSVNVESTRDNAAVCMAKVASYFKDPGSTRLSLGDVERVCNHAFPGLNLDPLYELVIDRNPGEKRAGDSRMVTGRINLQAAPFTWIRELNNDTAMLKAAVDQAEQFKMRILNLEKEAGLRHKDGSIGDIGNIGLGTALGQSILGKGDNDDETKSIYSDLMDPQHTSDLNSIRAKAVLSHVINDQDDPIRDVPLHRIAAKYNDIAAIAPHIARNPATLKPLLRRALQAAPQPFELQEMVGLERAINPNQPRKSDVE